MSVWLHQHWVALSDAWRRLTTAPLSTLLSLIAIGIALTLPALGFVLLDNLHQLAQRSSRVQQISIFLDTNASKGEVQAIEKKLQAANITDWKFVSKEAALKRIAGSADMRDIIAGLPQNPLPDAFVIEPRQQDPEAMEALAKQFKAWPRVAQVQLDSQWVKRFAAFLRTGRLIVILLSAIIAAGLVTVIFNTIRLQILSHSSEIEVARMIGATDAYIHRPFYYYGALQGALGGCLALLMVIGIHILLARSIAELASLYNGQFALSGPQPLQIAILLACGALLGWLGARLSVSMSLRSLH